MALKQKVSMEAVGIGVLIAFEIPNLFGNTMPHFYELADMDPCDSKWIRHGEITGATISLGVSLAGTMITQSPWPLLIGIAITAFMLWQFEQALKCEPKNSDKGGYTNG